MFERVIIRWRFLLTGWMVLIAGLWSAHGCASRPQADEVIIYCGVDEPYASKIFAEFEKQTGIRVAAQYDIESSKSVGLAGKLEAERDHPRADVWWSGEPFLSVRLANEGVLESYTPPAAADVLDEFKDPRGF